MTVWTVTAMGVVLAAASLGRAADPQVVTSYDLPFSSAGGVELRMDVAQPAMGRAPYPAVVVLHAGAWREGSKDENRRLLFDLDVAIQALTANPGTDRGALLSLTGVYHNLLRQWSET